MGASFRSTKEVLELAGCDKLTVAPKWLDEMLNLPSDTVTKKLDGTKLEDSDIKKIDLDEKQFRWMLNEDAMATEKLAEGIRTFTADLVKLEQLITKIYQEEKPSV